MQNNESKAVGRGFTACAALFTVLFGLFAFFNYTDNGRFGFAGTAFAIMVFFWVLAYALRNKEDLKAQTVISWLILGLMALGVIEELSH